MIIVIFLFLFLSTCEPDKCLIREKHYWDLLNPEYNIAKDHTAPMSGRTHSDETKQILSDAKKGTTLNDETRQKISNAMVGNTNNEYNSQKKQK